MAKPGNSGVTAGKPFQKGKSGNPSGRPKKREELQARCVKAVDEHVFSAWETEVTQRGEDWVACSKLLAAYGYGKPTQKVEHDGAEGTSVSISINRTVPK